MGVVNSLRPRFDCADEFAPTIIYRTAEAKPTRLIGASRTGNYQRLTTTADTITPGTDIRTH